VKCSLRVETSAVSPWQLEAPERRCPLGQHITFVPGAGYLSLPLRMLRSTSSVFSGLVLSFLSSASTAAGSNDCLRTGGAGFSGSTAAVRRM
jgi:hypothetical protein